MSDTHTEITKIFGHKLRVRVCGICINGNSILLVKHINIGEKDILWSPPGGGMEFGETAEECLSREFSEETGFRVRVINFLFINEYHRHPLHGIELFFSVQITDGNLKTGYDPEMNNSIQLIQEVSFVDFGHIKSGLPEYYHSLFKNVSSVEEILQLKGYFFNGSFLGNQ